MVVSFGSTKIPKLAVSLDRETNETNLFVPDSVRLLWTEFVEHCSRQGWEGDLSFCVLQFFTSIGSTNLRK